MKSIRTILALLLVMTVLASPSLALAEGPVWTCPECASENNTDFCTQCGAKRPESVVCPGCGKMYAIDTEAVFCGDCGTKLREEAPALRRYEGPGFASPEEAVSCYLEGLKELDFERMLSAFSWETQAEHYSVKLRMEQLKGTNPSRRPRMPSFHPFLVSANLHSIRVEQIDSIYRSLEAYLLGSDFDPSMPISFQTPEEVEAYLQQFDNGRLEELSELSNIRFLSPDEVTEGRFSTELVQKNFEMQKTVYGGDEVVNVVALADVGHKTLFCAPTVVRYGDRWYMVSVSSVTSSILGVSYAYQAFQVVEDMDQLR